MFSCGRGPDRFYFKFGKPFDTSVVDRTDQSSIDAAYAEIKSEVEGSISYLLHERSQDPYRAVIPRVAYEALNKKQAPSFPLRRSD